MDMGSQFQKLKDTIDNVVRFYIGVNKEYLGPVHPTALISFGAKNIRMNALVIAESVPALYFPFVLKGAEFPEHYHDIVIVYLDDNFEFRHYNAQTKELMGLSILIGDPAYQFDGTLNDITEFFKQQNFAFTILYKDR